MMYQVSNSPPAAPASLGRYQVIKRLGAGGMAEVFLAKSTGAEGIEKILVVKRVLPTFARSAKFITMFLEEAKIATRLNHPNIVQVYAFEQVKDEFLLAMEFVDGLDLGRLVSHARRAGVAFPVGLSAYIVTEVAKGLDYAHRRKDERGDPMEIVHRDVSPQNVLISFEGTVKLTDFGIARARMVSEDTGVIKGKFSYMSPEQARGKRVDRRSDVYGLGILLAELLMGRPMYQGQQGLDVLEQVRQGRKTLPKEVVPSIPAELDDIVRRATATERDERYQSARALATALSRFLHKQDELVDVSSLERFIGDVAPRALTSHGVDAHVQTEVTSPTVSGRVEREKQVKERRQVVVISGTAHQVDEEGMSRLTAIDEEVAGVFSDIAFKSDAVLQWEGDERERFKFIVGLRRANVQDPLTAVRVAVDIIEALHGHSADAEVAVTASLGVSKMLVSAIRDATGRLLTYEPEPAEMELVEDLSDAGAPGEILVTGDVYRMVRRVFAFDLEATRDIDMAANVGDREASVRAYSLRGALTRAERSAGAWSVDETPFEGRLGELERIREAYDGVALREKSHYLAVVGQLGIGKTALIAQALKNCNPRPRVLHAQCAFGSTDVPFSTISEMLRDASGVDDHASVEESVEQFTAFTKEAIRNAAERNVVLKSLLPIVAPQGATQEQGLSDHARVVIQAVRIILKNLAEKGPLVLWVDSLQWADGASLEIINRLLRRDYDLPLLAILVTRPDARIQPVLERAEALAIGELESNEMKSLVRHRFDDADVPADVLRAVTDRAGGNPFFAVELVETLLEKGTLRIVEESGHRHVVRTAGESMALPNTLEGAITARFDDVPEADRPALRWLSVTGPGFRSQELHEISGLDLDNSLQRLEQRGLVERGPGGTWRFPSAVFRHVAYENTDQDDRAAMHKRAGTYLAERRAPVPPAKIAKHLERAGDKSGAADAFLSSAEDAGANYSKRDALRFYGRALSLLPPRSSRRFRAHAAREEIYRSMSLRSEQHQELESMNALAEQLGDPKLRAIALCRTARMELDGNRSEGVEVLLRNAVEAALEAGDRHLEIEALRLSAILQRDLGQWDASIESCEQALSRAGHEDDFLATRGLVLVQEGITFRRSGRLRDAVLAFVEAAVVFRKLRLKHNESMALSSLGVALAALGEYEDALPIIKTSVVLDREVGDRIFLARKLSNVGQLYAELGDAKRALNFLERALDVIEITHDVEAEADALCAIAEILIELAPDPQRATGFLKRAMATARSTGKAYHLARAHTVLAKADRVAGRVEGALAHAVKARTASESASVGYQIQSMAVLASCLAAQGDREQAESVATAAYGMLTEQGEVERADRVYGSLARTFEILGQSDQATAARDEAEKLMRARAERIRSPELRATYDKWVQSRTAAG